MGHRALGDGPLYGWWRVQRDQEFRYLRWASLTLAGLGRVKALRHCSGTQAYVRNSDVSHYHCIFVYDIDPYPQPTLGCRFAQAEDWDVRCGSRTRSCRAGGFGDCW